jgi:hypothetical protein
MARRPELYDKEEIRRFFKDECGRDKEETQNGNIAGWKLLAAILFLETPHERILEIVRNSEAYKRLKGNDHFDQIAKDWRRCLKAKLDKWMEEKDAQGGNTDDQED